MCDQVLLFQELPYAINNNDDTNNEFFLVLLERGRLPGRDHVCRGGKVIGHFSYRGNILLAGSH